MHQNKAWYNFHKREQHPIAGRIKDLDQGLCDLDYSYILLIFQLDMLQIKRYSIPDLIFVYEHFAKQIKSTSSK